MCGGIIDLTIKPLACRRTENCPPDGKAADKFFRTCRGKCLNQRFGRGFLAEDDNPLNMRVMRPHHITGLAPEISIGDRLQLPPVRHDTQCIKPLHQRDDLFRVNRLILAAIDDFQQQLMPGAATRISKPDKFFFMIIDDIVSHQPATAQEPSRNG